MTSPGRRAFLGGLGASLLAAPGCGGPRPPETPLLRPGAPEDWLPSHLPIVLRLEWGVWSKAIPNADPLLARVLAHRLPPGARSIVQRCERLWCAARLTGAPDQALPIDSVLVLEGNFAGLDRRLWSEALLPPRELGSGVRRHDARDDTHRARPGRVYEDLGRCLAVASAAEVDPLERAVEEGHRERVDFPASEGALTWLIDPPHLARWLEPVAPGAAKLLERAVECSGTLNPDASAIEGELRLSFLEASEAEHGVTLLRWGIRGLGLSGGGGELSMQAEQRGASVVVRLRGRHDAWQAAFAPQSAALP